MSSGRIYFIPKLFNAMKIDGSSTHICSVGNILYGDVIAIFFGHYFNDRFLTPLAS